MPPPEGVIQRWARPNEATDYEEPETAGTLPPENRRVNAEVGGGPGSRRVRKTAMTRHPHQIVCGSGSGRSSSTGS
jgi:hypothetical protein